MGDGVGIFQNEKKQGKILVITICFNSCSFEIINKKNSNLD
jgi:hypothetical protein